ncbi:MAG: polysaccharide deacetylase family protein [Christensenellaceae bacterium]
MHFFMVQFWTEKYPEYVKKIDEAGHEIGTHSKTHPYMSKLSESEIREELSSSSGAITAVTGKRWNCSARPTATTTIS